MSILFQRPHSSIIFVLSYQDYPNLHGPNLLNQKYPFEIPVH
jgi:hypothetical protein